MSHLAIIAVMAMVAQGAYASMQEGMVLHPVGRLLARLPLWLHKPTHTCPVCMVSGWGLPAIAYTQYFSGEPITLALVPIYLLAAAGINWATA